MQLHLVLDVDGTLVAEASDESSVPALRPHLREFLEFAFATFETVSVWSNARSAWIAPILARIQEQCPHPGFHFVRTGDTRRAHSPQNAEVKRLKKLYKAHPRLTQDNTLILDNTPATYHQNYGNAIGIRTWFGEPDDRELLTITDRIRQWLPEFAERGTVRRTNKHAQPFARPFRDHMAW